MPTKPETRFYRRVNDRLPYAVHRQKVSSVYSNGTPDFWYSGRKADAWVEYKWLPKVSRNGVEPLKLLSALQAKWLNDRYAEGRNVLVIVGSPEGCVVLEAMEWILPVPLALFKLDVPEVSEVLTEIVHGTDSVSDESSTSD